MFAEELGGNAQKKRQEDARRRRLQLKQEQQRKQAQQQQKQAAAQQLQLRTVQGESQSTSTAASFVPSTIAAPPSVEEISGPSAAQDTGKNSAVANALQQRQLRQEAQQQRKAVLTIQSVWRCYVSNKQVFQNQSNLLGQRLSDLAKLRELLSRQSSTNTEYCPPPAMCTALCQQLLFITTSIPYLRSASKDRWTILRNPSADFQKLDQLLKFVILPGLLNADENINPLLVWKQSQGGRLRFESLIRLCLVAMTTSRVPESVLDTCINFLETLLGPQSPPALSDFCRPILLSPVPIGLSKIDRKKGATSQPHSKRGTNLDLFRIVRYQLLFGTGGPDPIPPTSEKLRNACIPAQDKLRADKLFQFLLNVSTTAKDREAFQLRLFTEILTIPLLPWKISDHSVTRLVFAGAESSSSRKILLIDWITTFTEKYADALNSGLIDQKLPTDLPLTICPATPSQCLLANVMELSRSSSQLNGSKGDSLDAAAAVKLFRMVGTLVDAVPLGTFLSRESVVEWISDGKGHHAPVVLSPVVMQQCRTLVSDGYVRKLLSCAIDETALETDRILKTKNDKDLKHEADLQASGHSAASLAAKEARIDRSKGFFNSSSWGKKLSKGVSKMFQANNTMSADSSKAATTKPNLINTSSVSKKLAASGGGARKEVETAKAVVRSESYNSDLLITLVRVYAIVLSRWGGGGKDDIVGRVRQGPLRKKDEQGAHQEVATSLADPCTQNLLSVICFSTPLLRVLWSIIQSDSNVVADVYKVIDSSKGKCAVRTLSARPFHGRNQVQMNNGAVLLFVFVCALAHVLVITDDTDIHDMDRPLPLHQLRRCIQTLKKLLYRACCVDDTHVSESLNDKKAPPSTYFGLALITWTSKTMRDLYDRSSRKPFCVPKMWLVEDLMEKDIRRCKTHDDYVALLTVPVLRVCPFLVSFKRRLKLFERIVTTNRVAIQGENSQNPFHTNPLKPGIPVRITRGRILEDGLATLNKLGPNLRQRIAVQYQNEAGTRETGIDAGGLFKEFWTDLSAIAFDPNYALFRVTEETNCMYPSPSSKAAHGADHIVLFEFLGRVLGKALYEGITIHPQFSHFFLSFIRGDYNYLHTLPDLSTMDQQLYNNLMFLKNYDGNAEDLCLTFTVANDDFGGNQEIPLIPNGSNMEVTNANKYLYIGLVAKHHVVDRMKEQSEAFTRGLWEVIDRSWLRLFNEPELQVLISGASGDKLDVEDMRSNTRYVGGYTGIDRNVNRFWNVVASLDSKEQGELLRFVTSCERAPPLGFASMNPPFTIQRVGILRDGDKLPTSSTCFNILKLPTYSSEKVMKERLLYAIKSGAGFELT